MIKIGGNVIDNNERLGIVLDACAAYSEPFVLVHGGGNVATEMAERLGVPQTMIEGRRITDADTLRILTMVFGGLVNKTIVSALQARGVNALGLTGADGNLTRAHKRSTGPQEPSAPRDPQKTNAPQEPQKTSAQVTDYGFVGDIDTVNTSLLCMLLQSGYCPVCAPLSHDGAGTMLNTNADDVARVLALAIASSGPESTITRSPSTSDIELIYVFDYAGVLRDVNDPHSAIPTLSRQESAQLLADGVITKGMLPKLENAFRAFENGVKQVRITRYDMLDGGTLIR